MGEYPHYIQHGIRECGVTCLSMIAKYYGLNLSMKQARELVAVNQKGTNMYELTQAAKRIGLEAESLEGSQADLLEGVRNAEFDVPFVARVGVKIGYEHYIVVWKIEKGKVIIGDPGWFRTRQISLDKFFRIWLGQIITFSCVKDKGLLE